MNTIKIIKFNVANQTFRKRLKNLQKKQKECITQVAIGRWRYSCGFHAGFSSSTSNIQFKIQ